MFEYTLIRSRRRTMSMQVNPDGAVVVRAPLKTAARDIERFAESHEGWVRKHRERMAAEAESSQPLSFFDGERVPLFGEELTLATGGSKVTREGDRLLMPEGSDRKAALAAFLREEAQEQIARLVRDWAERMDVSPRGMKITSAATRWGSCSGENRLCFSWRVACLPVSLAEYIVVHELSHIREHNHSSRFWAIVEAFLPDYKERRAALKAWQRRVPL